LKDLLGGKKKKKFFYRGGKSKKKNLQSVKPKMTYITGGKTPLTLYNATSVCTPNSTYNAT